MMLNSDALQMPRSDSEPVPPLPLRRGFPSEPDDLCHGASAIPNTSPSEMLEDKGQ